MKLSGLLSLLLATGSAACCSFDLDLGETDEPPPPAAPPPPGAPTPRRPGEVQLGDAEFPRGAAAPRTDHPWWLRDVVPSRYRLGYKLAADRAQAIAQAYQGFARRVRHRKVDKDRFNWLPPPGCAGGMHCVYDALAAQGWDSVAPITALFARRAKEARLDGRALAKLVIGFVQEIDYRIPEDEPFGILPPALVVRQKWGDCDSKTLLAHMILGGLGIDTILVSSEAHKHTMLGLAQPAPGASFTWRGSRYAFVELTAKRAPIGFIDPKLKSPNDWRVQLMRYDVTRPVAAAPPAPAAPPKAPAPAGTIRVRRWGGAVDGGGIRLGG